ncbi:MAG: rhodanese-like domain-containing protein [Pontiella sp.]
MKMVKTRRELVIMGIIANIFSKGRAHAVETPTIKELIRNGALVIDVRSGGEFSGGQIKGAINIPHDQISALIVQHETDKSRCIIVYCLSGMRSSAAKKTLEKLGYTNVVNGGTFKQMQNIR